MDRLLGAVAQLGELKVRNDDDFVDRLSRRYTTFFLVLFAILVSTKQYVGEPINCWVPARFTENHEEYTNKICWVSNTYYMSFAEQVPAVSVERTHKIGYYQWVPMILLAQACLFFLPCFIWRVLSKRSGINLKAIIEAALVCQRAGTMGEGREKTLSYIINHLDTTLNAQRKPKDGYWHRFKNTIAKYCIVVCGRTYGNYLTTTYLIAKILYIANAIGQLFMLNIFLGTDFHMFGVHVLKALVRGEIWKPTGRFPRVTLCDFEIRELGNVNKHTVQCVLPINLFNEKIYVFIWFWFVFIATITVLNMLQWLLKCIRREADVEYIKSHLKSMDRINRETDISASRFCSEYLLADGVFVLRLLAKNAGDLMSAEVSAGLFDVYGRDQRLLVEGPHRPAPLAGLAPLPPV